MLNNTRFNVKTLIRNGMALVTLSTVFGIGVIWWAQARVADSTRASRVAEDLRFRAKSIYAEGLQMGQATRNIVVDPSNHKAYDNFNAAEANFGKELGELEPLIAKHAPELNNQTKRIRDLYLENKDVQLQVHELAKKGDGKGAIELLNGKETPTWRECRALILEIAAKTIRIAQEKDELAATQLNQEKWIVGVLLALMMAVPFFIYRTSTLLLTRLQEETDTLITTASDSAKFSENLSGASQNLSTATTESAASLEETAASIEELSAMAKQNAEYSQQAAGFAEQARTIASDGSDRLQALSTAMKGVQDSSGKIANIVGVIEDIAFQTNLLALNAAVEAARAGEQGKGFAVVAEAVRTLAQRSASATKDISQLIQESTQNVDVSSRAAEETSKALGGMVSSVQKIVSLIGEIATATREQSISLDQVRTATQQLDQTAQSNSSAANEASSMADAMRDQALTVNTAIGQILVLLGVGGNVDSKLEHKFSTSHAMPKSETPFAKRKTRGPGKWAA